MQRPKVIFEVNSNEEARILYALLCEQLEDLDVAYESEAPPPMSEANPVELGLLTVKVEYPGRS